MVLDDLNFSHMAWLWGILLVPAVWLLYNLSSHREGGKYQLDDFIDEHLLPHLLLNKKITSHSIWSSLSLWSIVWILAMVALAGPRWDYKEINVYTADQNLVVLLDLSWSMNAEDEKPSRIVKAKQEIEDILRSAQGLQISLIAFAADPHMISPLTDDVETIRHSLPSLDTDLPYVQGSELSPALEMAYGILTPRTAKNKSILVISDGGFEDISSAISLARKLASEGIVIHTMGIGSKAGAPVKDAEGNFIIRNNQTVLSRLEEDKLRAISGSGGGEYLWAHYSDQDTRVIFDYLALPISPESKKEQKVVYWEERFYLFIFPILVVLFFWFRKGFIFPVILFLLHTPLETASAGAISDYFRNSQQQGKYALQQENYDKALEKFKDPYRQGVVHYKAGDFSKAEKYFEQSSRPEVAKDAAYNLGNSFARQQKYDRAIEIYQSLLEKNPDHKKARHNLEIVKKLYEQQQDLNSDGNQRDNNRNNKDKDNSNASAKKDQSEPSENNGEDKQQGNKPEDQRVKDQEKNNVVDSREDSFGKESSDPIEDGEKKNHQFSAVSDENEAERNVKTQQDIDADQWLNRVTNNPKDFLRKQFYIESKQREKKRKNNPW